MLYYRHTDLLLALLRLALWGDKAPFQALKPVSDVEWGVAFHLAANHTVQGLAWQGFSLLEADELPPSDLLCTWTARAAQLEQASRSMNGVLATLILDLRAQGLEPVVIKGQTVAELYSQPLLRETGDIDLFFTQPEQFEHFRQLHSNGNKTPDGCYRVQYHGVEVESHPKCIDIVNPFAAPTIRHILSNDAFRTMSIAEGQLSVLAPTPEVNVLLLSTHVMKHAFGRGIGLRQICDLAMACARYEGVLDADRLRQLSSDLGITRWNRLLFSFMVCQLGLPRQLLPYPVELSKSQGLSNRVLFGGNFGRMTYPPSKSVMRRKATTAFSLIRNSFWSMRCAPMETLFSFSRLSFGQIR